MVFLNHFLKSMEKRDTMSHLLWWKDGQFNLRITRFCEWNRKMIIKTHSKWIYIRFFFFDINRKGDFNTKGRFIIQTVYRKCNLLRLQSSWQSFHDKTWLILDLGTQYFDTWDAFQGNNGYCKAFCVRPICRVLRALHFMYITESVF